MKSLIVRVGKSGGSDFGVRGMMAKKVEIVKDERSVKKLAIGKKREEVGNRDRDLFLWNLIKGISWESSYDDLVINGGLKIRGKFF